MNTTLAAFHGGFHGYGPAWHAGFPWPLVVIPLFWIALIVVVALLFGRRWRRAAAVRAAGGWGHPGFGGPGFGGFGAAPWAAGAGSWEAERTLADRFARGDIDEVEYRARLEVLRANRPAFGSPQGPSAPFDPPAKP